MDESDVAVSGVRQNPKGLLPRVRDRYWVPIGRIAMSIDAQGAAAASAAQSGDLAGIRAALETMLKELVGAAAAITPEVWHAMEMERIEKWQKGRVKKGKSVDPKKLVPKPFAESLHLTSAYWKPIHQLIEWLKDPVRLEPPFTIFTKGSSKLPFYQWSTVPGLTCPGAGKCWDIRPSAITLDADGNPRRNQASVPRKAYCYSLNGWRNVYPYLRQLQNTILTRLPDKSHIEHAMREIERVEPETVVRLFVDGDFDSLATLEYWMHLCERFPKMSFYGYSKSWHLFVEYDSVHGGKWPANYLLNLSNGNMWETLGGEVFDKMRAKMIKLSITRGAFIAIKNVVHLDGSKSTMPKMTDAQAAKNLDPRDVEGHREHMDDVRRAAVALGIENPFPCPGKCYACLGPKDVAKKEQLKSEKKYGKHACGWDQMIGRNIVIAVH